MERAAVRRQIISHMLDISLSMDHINVQNADHMWDDMEFPSVDLRPVNLEIYVSDDPYRDRVSWAAGDKDLIIKQTGSYSEGLFLPSVIRRDRFVREIIRKKHTMRIRDVSAENNRYLVYSRNTEASHSRNETVDASKLHHPDYSQITCDDIGYFNNNNTENFFDPFDLDLMIVDLERQVDATENKQNEKCSLYFEPSKNSGYIYVCEKESKQKVASGTIITEKVVDAMMGAMLTFLQEAFLDVKHFPSKDDIHRHGPALSFQIHLCGLYESGPEFCIVKDIDLVYALWCPDWPCIAKDWPERMRSTPSGWPDAQLIDESLQDGVHVVPVCHFSTRHENEEWRVSFSKPESLLSRNLAKHPHLHKAYLLVKLICKYTPSIHLATYHLKNTLYWLCIDVLPMRWTVISVLDCVEALFLKLNFFLTNKCIPHFFITDRNMINHLPAEKLKSTQTKIHDILRDPLEYIFTILSNWIIDNKEYKLKQIVSICNYAGYNTADVLQNGLFVTSFINIKNDINDATINKGDWILSCVRSTFTFYLSLKELHTPVCLQQLDIMCTLFAQTTKTLCQNCRTPQVKTIDIVFALADEILDVNDNSQNDATEVWDSWFYSSMHMDKHVRELDLIYLRLLKANRLHKDVMHSAFNSAVNLKQEGTSINIESINKNDEVEKLNMAKLHQQSFRAHTLTRKANSVRENLHECPNIVNTQASRYLERVFNKLGGTLATHGSNKLNLKDKDNMQKIRQLLDLNMREIYSQHNDTYIHHTFYSCAMLEYLHGDIKRLPQIFDQMYGYLENINYDYRKQQITSETKESFMFTKPCDCGSRMKRQFVVLVAVTNFYFKWQHSGILAAK